MKNNTETDKLNKQLSRHYLEKSLNDEQLARLQSLQNTKTPTQYKVYTSIAAGGLLAVLGYLYQAEPKHLSTISKDIAYNHNSQLQMEVLSHELQTVQGRLNRLGFQLVSSNKLEEGKWQLIGGRYCNINGKIAAQMKLRNAESKAIYTFYQAKVPNEFINSLSDKETAIDGVKVKLWREKGLLMGLAF